MPSRTFPFPVWQRIVRFIAEDGQEYCGEPVDAEVDGIAMVEGESVMIKVLNSQTVLEPNATFTGEILKAKTILSPLTPSEVGTIRCIGLNYTDHAAEMKLPLPTYPEIFHKPSTCVLSATSPLIIPCIAAHQTDPEVELAIVIKEDCKNVSTKKALDYVLGYMTANDVTARIVQGRGSQWGYSKGFDGFAPMGPVLVSAERIPDPSVLELKTVLDGRVMQDKPARNMIFGVPEIVSYLSVGTTLKKGTIILTGTPSGIGHSYNPPIYLKQGSNLKISISHGLGTLVNPIIEEEPTQLE